MYYALWAFFVGDVHQLKARAYAQAFMSVHAQLIHTGLCCTISDATLVALVRMRAAGHTFTSS